MKLVNDTIKIDSNIKDNGLEYVNIDNFSFSDEVIQEKPKVRFAYQDDNTIKLVKEYKEGFAWAKVLDNNTFSLRDKKNNSIITISFNDDGQMTSILDINGLLPSQKHIKYVNDVFKKKFISDNITNELINKLGFIYSKKRLYTLTSLPRNAIIENDLDFTNNKNINVVKLPNNLTINGSLILSNCNITSLPSNLTINGSLLLDNTNISKFPKNLKVTKDLSARNTTINKLPNDLFVGGNLDISNTKVNKINNFKLGGILIISGLDNIKLDNLQCNGITANNTRFIKAPKNIEIWTKGNLILDKSNIRYEGNEFILI